MNPFKERDPFDLALALYHWLQHHWEGQGDDLYKDFCRLTAPGVFKAGCRQEFFENISDDARAVYDSLTRENYGAALDLVLGHESEE